jgi:hypothetical protein
LPLLDDVENLVNEAVETQETLKLEELRARTDESLGGLTGETGIRNHFAFLAEKDWRDKLRRLT